MMIVRAITAITTRKIVKVIKAFNHPALPLVVCTLAIPEALAGDLSVSSGISSSVTVQDRQSETLDNRLTTLSISPSLTTSFSSPKLIASATAKTTHFERSSDDVNQKNFTTSLSYNGTFNVIDNNIFVFGGGSINYGSPFSSRYLLEDELTGSSELVKTEQRNIGTSLSFMQNDWVSLQSTFQYSQVNSDANTSSGYSGLDRTNKTLSLTLGRGDRFNNIRWNLIGNRQESSSDNSSNSVGDLKTENVRGLIDLPLYRDFSARVSGSYTNNDYLTSDGDQNTVGREYSTYGAGLTYAPSESRIISITYNLGSTGVTGEEKENFIGIDVNWAFSNRSSFSLSRSRSFYGERLNGQFNLNSKRFRSALQYEESVTNSALLLSNYQSLGTFVCPIGITEIQNCFIPNSLDYTLQANEVYVEFGQNSLELDENTLLHKSLNLQLGYQFNKLSFGLSGQATRFDYLDFNRVRDTITITGSSSYVLGRNTSVSITASVAKITEDSPESDRNGDTTNLRFSLGLNRQIGKAITVNARGSYLRSDGDISTDSLLGSNYSERRVSTSITYSYDVK